VVERLTPKDSKYEILKHTEPEDLIKFGMIPELVGRLPVIASLEELDEDALTDILYKPTNALIKQYQYLFKQDGVELRFTKGALREIAALAKKRGTGARGLRSITEKILLDLMFELPSKRGTGAEIIIDTKDVRRHFTEGPIVDFVKKESESEVVETSEVLDGQLLLPSAEGGAG